MAAMRAKVAVLKTKPETVLDDYERLMSLAEMRRFLAPDTTTMLKDNISWHFPFPSANSTPWQLEGVIRALRHAGYDDLVCVQNQTVVTNAFKGEDLNHFVAVLRRHGVPIRYNFRPEDMIWQRYEPAAQMLALHKIFPEGLKIPDYFLGKNVVHLPTVKCHIYTTTTGAMKNAFGGLLSERRFQTHSYIHETLVDLLAIQQEIHPGIFAVMDGTTAGNGAGPRIMDPQIKNVILASGDQVAIDAVAAKLMGFDPLSIGYIRIAHERGLGVGDVREIEMVGDDVSGENWNFKVGKTFHSMLGYLAWFGPTKHLQKIIFNGPWTPATYFVSEAYHDWYRWPMKEKVIYERWREWTPWGQMFQEYERRGHLWDPEAEAEQAVISS